MDENKIKELVNEYIQELVGDTSVARQLDAALRAHEHDNYLTREEYDELKKKVEQLSSLVGDTSIVEQISIALNG